MVGSAPDLLRLVVVPVFAWAAWRDVKTRRLPNRMWYPLAALGVVLLVWDVLARLPLAGIGDRLFLVRVAVSLGLVAPLGYVFWRIGGFGGADAKALMVLAVLFPAYPHYRVAGAVFPAVETALGVFSLTILTDAVLVGLAYPVALAARNALDGEVGRAMFLARRTPVLALPETYGRVFETRDGFTRNGLDVDALRMYLQWRGTTLAALLAAPDRHRDPASVGETYDPGDGAIDPSRRRDDEPVEVQRVEADGPPGESPRPDDGDAPDGFDDPWGAAAFLESIEGTAYGTTPETLREGLELLVERETVWVSPGLPFIVPMFVGLVAALTVGDLLTVALVLLGVA